MRIIGPEKLVFGIEDFEKVETFCRDFGLAEVSREPGSITYEARNSDQVVVKAIDDPELPKSFANGPTLRQVFWSVPDLVALEEIAAELSKDRDVTREGDVVHSVDDCGMAISFCLTSRNEYQAERARANVPGHYQRGVNERIDFDPPVQPIGIAHVVLDVLDHPSARDFYINRLGFVVSDAFEDTGTFLRTALASEHHQLFLIKKPRPGLNHIAFYVRDFHELVVSGKKIVSKGWDTKWGPGRHKLGSNYFWYVHAPLGGAFEFTCDVDHVDENWEPGSFEFSFEMTNIWSEVDFRKPKTGN